ncbi:hypothetical protein AB4Z21_26310, partial [Paenibacillus sp. MCAF20]
SYIIYVLLSAGVLALIHRISVTDWLLRVIIVSFLPVIGWLLPICWPRSWVKQDDAKLDAFVTAQQKEVSVLHEGIYSKVEAERELDVIPIEDALLVSEHGVRRKVMIDVLKQDSMRHMELLQEAVSNEDTETSHYAVSAIMEIKRKLALSLQELSVQYETDKQDEHLLLAYIGVLKSFMKSGFLDERTLRQYKFTYLSVLQSLLEVSPNTEFAYPEKVNTELELELYVEAEETGHLYASNFPQSEEAYLTLMKVYFSTKSSDKLQDTLNSLKKSPLNLSNRALTLVRFWSEGA